MTDNDKALVERLREEADEWDEPKSHDEFDMRGMLHSTANRIEALSAENERLLDIDEVKANAIDSLLNDLASAEQENERLREALGWFLNDSRFVVQVGGNPYVVPQMIEEARARLGLTE